MMTLDRFRIVKLSKALQKEFDLPELICANPEGLPFLEGQAFYAWVIDNACEPTTARNYLNALLPFLTFLWIGPPTLRYTAPADQIRPRVRDYLKEKLGCAVRPHWNGNYLVRTSQAMTGTSARLFLTALRRFYYCAIVKGWYPDANPLEWTTPLIAPRTELKLKMPPRSGLTLPDHKPGRMPDTYFCVVAGDWHPHIIDDPHLRQRLVPAFTRIRDRVIARILFDSGARISEVLGLRMGDWRKLGQGERAMTTNKGSRGEHVKEIWWSADTTQVLRDYLNCERRQYDATGRGLEALPDSAPIFITEAGQPYTYAAFYANWQKVCALVQIKITPHQVRHWYVTMALHVIEAQPNETKRTAYRQSLIAYMGWHNPETVQAYAHHVSALNFAPTHSALTRLGEAMTGHVTQVPPSEMTTPVGLNIVSEEFVARLGQSFGWEPEAAK